MRISNLKKQLVIIGIVIAAAIVTIPQAAMAGGGAFPGAGCADPSVGKWKYAPPPFIGKIQACYDSGTGNILLFNFDDAPLVQNNGQASCELWFDEGGINIGPLVDNLDDFSNLKSVDIQGLCLPDKVVTCATYTDIELLSVANMKFNGVGDCFTAHVVVMALTTK